MIQRKYLALLILFIVFMGSAYFARLLDTDFGNITVEEVSIPGDGHMISGTLYVPKGLTGKTPAVVLSHGISNAKETLSGVALELARNGYVALTVDLRGHGETGIGVDNSDSTLGLKSAVDYISTIPYVDGDRIAIGGHSMGAGAARIEATYNPKIMASIFIGGGISDEGSSSTTIPSRNLLIIVGKNDLLFNVSSLENTLISTFGTSETVEPNRVYGDFITGTARKLVVIGAIHLTEPIDPTTAKEIVAWINASANPGEVASLVKEPVFLIRDGLMVISLAAFIALLIPFSQVINGLLPGRLGDSPTVRHRFLRERSVLLLWSLLGFVMFLPAMFLGAIIAFPPLLFGASMAWWLLATGIIGFMIFVVSAMRQPKGSVDISSLLLESLKVRDIAIALIIFAFLYTTAFASDVLYGEKLRLIVPIFQPLIASRAQVAPLFIPFYLVYFLAEGLFLHVYRDRQTAGSAARNLGRTLLLKLGPYLFFLTIQYLPMLLINFRLLPSMIGFYVEFIWLIIPLLVVSTFSSWWLYRYMGRIWTGVILNTLLFAWVSAGLFPFNAFR